MVSDRFRIWNVELPPPCVGWCAPQWRDRLKFFHSEVKYFPTKNHQPLTQLPPALDAQVVPAGVDGVPDGGEGADPETDGRLANGCKAERQ